MASSESTVFEWPTVEIFGLWTQRASWAGRS